MCSKQPATGSYPEPDESNFVLLCDVCDCTFTIYVTQNWVRAKNPENHRMLNFMPADGHISQRLSCCYVRQTTPYEWNISYTFIIYHAVSELRNSNFQVTKVGPRHFYATSMPLLCIIRLWISFRVSNSSYLDMKVVSNICYSLNILILNSCIEILHRLYNLHSKSLGLSVTPNNYNYMGWEASNSHSYSQEIPWLSWNPKVHYRVHMTRPQVSILSWLKPVYNFPVYFSGIHSNTIITSTPKSSDSLLVFRAKFYTFLISVRAAWPAHLILVLITVTNIWWSV